MQPAYLFVNIYLLCYFSLFSSCGITEEHTRNKVSILHEFLEQHHFPNCFSISATVDCSNLQSTFRYRVEFCVMLDQHIQFVIKGPLGIEVIRGMVDENGITILDRLHRVCHRWCYKQIRQQYLFKCNYLLIRSFLLGTVYIPKTGEKEALHTSVELCKYLSYTYDNLTGQVIQMQLVDEPGSNTIRCLYQRRTLPLVNHFTDLTEIQIRCALTNYERLYQGSIALHKLKFKQLRKPNIKFIVPGYYIQK